MECKHERKTTFTYRHGTYKQVEEVCLDCLLTISLDIIISTTEVASASSLAGEQRNDGG